MLSTSSSSLADCIRPLCYPCAPPPPTLTRPAPLTHPTPTTYYKSRGLWKEAVGFFDVMKEEGLTPDKVTFNTAIAAVASSGRCQTAFSLLAEMNKEGLKPDQVP